MDGNKRKKKKAWEKAAAAGKTAVLYAAALAYATFSLQYRLSCNKVIIWMDGEGGDGMVLVEPRP